MRHNPARVRGARGGRRFGGEMMNSTDTIVEHVLDAIKGTLKEPSGVFKHPYISPGGVYSQTLWDWGLLLDAVRVVRRRPETVPAGHRRANGPLRARRLLQLPRAPGGGWFPADSDHAGGRRPFRLQKLPGQQHGQAVHRAAGVVAAEAQIAGRRGFVGTDIPDPGVSTNVTSGATPTPGPDWSSGPRTGGSAWTTTRRRGGVRRNPAPVCS